MSVDTEIKGDPGKVEGAADWLRDSLAKRLDDAADSANDSRRSAAGSWNSVAGEEFGDMMSRARGTIDGLEKAARTMAGDLDSFATKLRRAQEEMGDVRTTARGAGLTVTGFAVLDPGEGPARPPDDFVGTPDEVRAHNGKVRAYDAHQDLVRAYGAASREAARIDRYYAAACRSLQSDYTVGQHAFWLVTVADVVGSGGVAALGVHLAGRRSGLHRQAQSLVDEASRAIRDMQANPDQYMKRKWFFLRTLDETKLEVDRLAIQGKLKEADDLLSRAKAVEAPRGLRYLAGASKILGPAAVGLSLYNDYRDGETVPQIAVSQGVGTGVGVAVGAGATILTSAAVGAAVGSVIPGIGTVVGAGVGTLVGAGAAVFTDGAIDSLFENGPDAGAAVEAGWDAVTDTTDAVGAGIGGAVKAVGGWFD